MHSCDDRISFKSHTTVNLIVSLSLTYKGSNNTLINRKKKEHTERTNSRMSRTMYQSMTTIMGEFNHDLLSRQ